MIENKKAIKTAIYMNSALACLIAGAIFFISKGLALTLILTNILMLLNLWILLTTLMKLFTQSEISVAKPLLILLLKTLGLFSITYVAITYFNANPLTFGLTAALTVVVFSLTLVYFQSQEALS